MPLGPIAGARAAQIPAFRAMVQWARLHDQYRVLEFLRELRLIEQQWLLTRNLYSLSLI